MSRSLACSLCLALLGLGCGGDGEGGGGRSSFVLVPDVPEALAYYAVWSFSPSDVWIAADGGRMLHYDGSTWATQDLGGGATMVDIWGFAPDDIVAVGGTTLARYDGSTWMLEDLSAAGAGISSVSAVWGTSADDLWVSGDQGPTTLPALLARHRSPGISSAANTRTTLSCARRGCWWFAAW